jgi:hypothetical protein
MLWEIWVGNAPANFSIIRAIAIKSDRDATPYYSYQFQIGTINMNLRHLAIGFSAFSLLQLCALTISPNGRLSVGIEPASASNQTDGLWRQYFGGRKIVEFNNYSSSYGGGGMSSKKELHFCSNGQFAYAADSSVSMNVSGANGSSSGSNSSTGTWKIIESNRSMVAIEFASSAGERQQGAFAIGQDGRLYNGSGKKLLTTASDACN